MYINPLTVIHQNIDVNNVLCLQIQYLYWFQILYIIYVY